MIHPGLWQAPSGRRREATPDPAGQDRDVGSALASGTRVLRRAGVQSARLDAECLLAHLLGCARWQVVLEPGRRLTSDQGAQYRRLLRRREAREPLAYLVGWREFWSLPLSVSPGVLVPRPETETLVEAALAVLGGTPISGTGCAQRANPVIVDLCTGSGAIAIALARELPAARVLATDISPRALRVARRNAAAHGVAERIAFLEGDLWGALSGRPADAVDLAVANPPYVPSGVLTTLMPEVQWEPKAALDGGPDGLRVLGRIIAAAPQHLRPGGFLVLEIGADQAIAVTALFQGAGRYEPPRVLQDLAGRDRVISARTHADGM